MFFAAGPVEAAITNKSMGWTVPDDKKAMAGYGSYDDVMAALEHALSKSDYVAGNRFTAADVYFGSQIGWGMMFGSLDKRPALEAYWQRISARPAMARANQLDDALMPKQPAAS
jgi:glutathione S-transferase